MMMIPAAILAIEDEDDRTFMIRLYVDYRWYMYKIAFAIVRDAQIAEDMVSQAVCELIDDLGNIRKINCCKLKAYIASLVRNDSLDFVRKRNRQSKYFYLSRDEAAMDKAADGSVEETLIRKAEIAELKRGLARISEGERTLLMMKYFDEMSDEAIAEKFGIGKASVRTYLTRARRRLCQVMKEGDRDEGKDSSSEDPRRT